MFLYQKVNKYYNQILIGEANQMKEVFSIKWGIVGGSAGV